MILVIKFGFHKIWVISELDENQLHSHEGLCYMELASQQASKMEFTAYVGRQTVALSLDSGSSIFSSHITMSKTAACSLPESNVIRA
jgi:hypothetical protein